MTDLEPLTLPTADAGTDAWSAWLATRTDDQLSAAREQIAALKADRPDQAAELLDRWNGINLALANAFAASSLIQQVHPDAAIRERAEQAQVEAHRLLTDLSLDREVYELMVVDDAEQRTSGLGDDAERVRNFALRDFRRSGVDRDQATRTGSARSTSARPSSARPSSATSATTSRPSRCARSSSSASRPTGSRPTRSATTASSSSPWTTPTSIPMLTFATDREARLTVATAFNNRAWPVNDEVLVELLELRQEHAALLGYDGWPAYDAEVKMIETGDAIPAFIDKISKASEASALRDRDIILERIRQDRPDAEALDGADTRFYIEAIKREQHERRRPGGAPLLRVREGPPGAARRDRPALRARLRPRSTRPPGTPTSRRTTSRWPAQPIGRIHLDLHPRANKFKPCRAVHPHRRGDRAAAARGRAGLQLPPGLMEHDDVVTLFHEFGHLSTTCVGGHQRWARFTGVATEWDFVEAPSQLLEEWAWDADRPAGLRDRRRRDADPGRPGGADARGRGLRQGTARPGPRCSTPRCPTGPPGAARGRGCRLGALA